MVCDKWQYQNNTETTEVVAYIDVLLYYMANSWSLCSATENKTLTDWQNDKVIWSRLQSEWKLQTQCYFIKLTSISAGGLAIF